MPIRTKVLVGRQAGKWVLTGMYSFSSPIDWLRNGAMKINPEAQRSIAKGANKQTTTELLDDDKAHITPRMKEFVSFCEHLIRLSEEDICGEGFLGAVQVVVPEEFQEARVVFRQGAEDPDLDKGVRVAEFVAKPERGEAAFHLGDGQGRLVGFHSLERTAKARVDELERKIKKAQRAGEDPSQLQEQVEAAKLFRKKVNNFLSTNHIPVVCYVAAIADDGTVTGLDTQAEKRLYIEGNALNSQATKEEVVKYEAYSPVILELVNLRLDIRFMAPEYIEEDSKSIGLKSPKVFTLSALAKAFSVSVTNDENPIKPSTHEDFRPVRNRAAFARAYWEKIDDIFGKRWTSPEKAGEDFGKYLTDKREKKIVCFSAIFLEALGQVGYALGQQGGWSAEAPELELLEKFRTLEYDPSEQPRWRSLMMKESSKESESGAPSYVFNNVRDSAQKVAAYLKEELGIAGEGQEEDDAGAAEMAATAVAEE
jgi:hypothetical protein